MDEKFNSFAQDLLSLEVNTVIKPSMTASKMHHCRRLALYKIAGIYDETLSAMQIDDFDPDLATFLRNQRLEATFRAAKYYETGGMRSFGELRDRAGRGLKIIQRRVAQGKLTPQDRNRINDYTWKLQRINEHCGSIVGIFCDLAKAQGISREQYPPRIPGGVDATRIDKSFFSVDWSQDWGKLIGYYSDLEPSRLDSMDEEAMDRILRAGLVHSEVVVKKHAGVAAPDLTWCNDIAPSEMDKTPDLELSPNHITIIHKAWDIGMEKVVAQTIICLDGDITTRVAENLAPDLLNIHKDNFKMAVRCWGFVAKLMVNVTKTLFSKFS